MKTSQIPLNDDTLVDNEGNHVVYNPERGTYDLVMKNGDVHELKGVTARINTAFGKQHLSIDKLREYVKTGVRPAKVSKEIDYASAVAIVDAIDYGTTIHDEISKHIHDGEPIHTYAAQNTLRLIRNKFPAEQGWQLLSEVPVTDYTTYASQIDLLAINQSTGETHIIDLKTGTYHDAQTSLQLQTYKAMLKQTHPELHVKGTWGYSVTSRTNPWHKGVELNEDRYNAMMYGPLDRIRGKTVNINDLDVQMAKKSSKEFKQRYGVAKKDADLGAPIVFYDIETGGHEEPISIFAAKMALNRDTGKWAVIDTYEKYYKFRKKVLSPADRQTIEVHGLSPEVLEKLGAKGKYGEKAAARFSKWVGDSAMVGLNNKEFDYKKLWRESDNTLQYRPNVPQIDLMEVSQNITGKGWGNNLEDVYQRFTGQSMWQAGLPHHMAYADVAALIDVFPNMMSALSTTEQQNIENMILRKGKRMSTDVRDAYTGMWTQDVEAQRNTWQSPPKSKWDFYEQETAAMMDYLDEETQEALGMHFEGLQSRWTDDRQDSRRPDLDKAADAWLARAEAQMEQNIGAQWPQGKSVMPDMSAAFEGLTDTLLKMQDVYTTNMREALSKIMTQSTDISANVATMSRVDLRRSMLQQAQRAAAANMTYQQVDEMANLMDFEPAMFHRLVEGSSMTVAAKELHQQQSYQQRLAAAQSMMLSRNQAKVRAAVFHSNLSDADKQQLYDQLASAPPGATGFSVVENVKYSLKEQQAQQLQAQRDRKRGAEGTESWLEKIELLKQRGQLDERFATPLMQRALSGDVAGMSLAVEEAKRRKAEREAYLGSDELREHLWQANKADLGGPKYGYDGKATFDFTELKKSATGVSKVLKAVAAAGNMVVGAMKGMVGAYGEGASGTMTAMGQIASDIPGGERWARSFGRFNAGFKDAINLQRNQLEQVGNVFSTIGGTAGGIGRIASGDIAGGLMQTGSSLFNGVTNGIRLGIENRFTRMQESLHLFSSLTALIKPLDLVGRGFTKLWGYMANFMNKMATLGNPLTSLTGVDYSSYQRAGMADMALGFQEGTVNSMYESWENQAHDLYTVGRLNRDRLVSTAILGQFGNVYGRQGGSSEERFANTANDLVRQLNATTDPTRKSDIMARARDIDANLPNVLQRMIDLNVSDFRKLTDPKYWATHLTQKYGGTYNHILQPLTAQERTSMRVSSTEWQVHKQSMWNSGLRIADKFWQDFAEPFVNKVDTFLSKIANLVKGGNWDDALSEIGDTVGKIFGKIAEVIGNSGLMASIGSKIAGALGAPILEGVLKLATVLRPTIMSLVDAATNALSGVVSLIDSLSLSFGGGGSSGGGIFGSLLSGVVSAATGGVINFSGITGKDAVKAQSYARQRDYDMNQLIGGKSRDWVNTVAPYYVNTNEKDAWRTTGLLSPGLKAFVTKSQTDGEQILRAAIQQHGGELNIEKLGFKNLKSIPMTALEPKEAMQLAEIMNDTELEPDAKKAAAYAYMKEQGIFHRVADHAYKQSQKLDYGAWWTLEDRDNYEAQLTGDVKYEAKLASKGGFMSQMMEGWKQNLDNSFDILIKGLQQIVDDMAKQRDLSLHIDLTDPNGTKTSKQMTLSQFGGAQHISSARMQASMKYAAAGGN